MNNYSMLVLRQALALELKGMKRHGRSAYAIIKEQFNLRGNRQSVYEQYCRYLSSIGL